MVDKRRAYRISVGSAYEFEELIAEIEFDNKLGIIVSQESGEGVFEISIYSLHNQSNSEFYDMKNKEESKVPLEYFLDSIHAAQEELIRLKRTK